MQNLKLNVPAQEVAMAHGEEVEETIILAPHAPVTPAAVPTLTLTTVKIGKAIRTAESQTDIYCDDRR